MRDALATHDWAQPLLLAVPPINRAVNRAIRNLSTPDLIRKFLIATEFLRHNGSFFDWTSATSMYWKAIAEDFRPDVTWGTFGDSDTLHIAREIARRSSAPWGMDIKDAWHSFVPAGLRRLLARRFADADFLTTNSLFTKTDSEQWFSHDAHTIYSGAPAAAFEGEETVAERTIVMMGSIYSSTAFAEFAQGLANWLRNRTSNEPVRFVYAGVSEELVKEYTDLAGLCEVETHRHLGLEDLMALCRSAMVNCYIVSRRGFHHKVIELLCCGRPVLSYPGEKDEELELARSVGADFSSCESISDIEAALQRSEDRLEEPRYTDAGLRTFSWEMQGLVVEDVLTRAAARRS